MKTLTSLHGKILSHLILPSNDYYKIIQEFIPVGCVPPARYRTGGLPDRDTPGQRPPPPGRRPSPRRDRGPPPVDRQTPVKA